MNVLNDQEVFFFFLPWWHGHIPGWRYQYSSRVVPGTRDVIFTHGLATTGFRPQPHWKYLGCTGEDFIKWSDSPTINTIQDRGEKLDGDKRCEVAQAFVNVSLSPVSRSNEILECATLCFRVCACVYVNKYDHETQWWQIHNAYITKLSLTKLCMVRGTSSKTSTRSSSPTRGVMSVFHSVSLLRLTAGQITGITRQTIIKHFLHSKIFWKQW